MQTRGPFQKESAKELLGGEFHKKASYSNLRPQGSGDWLMIYTLAGAGRFITSSGSYDTREGDVVLYSPQDFQDYSTAQGMNYWNLLWVHFSPKIHWQSWLHWPISQQGIRLLYLAPGEVRERFVAALRQMVSLSQRKLPGALDLANNALEEALLWVNVLASKDKWMTMDGRVRKAIDYLAAHPREPFNLEKLARHCGASVSRLALLFKEETSTTPQQFFEKNRMQRASQLLRLTSLSIAEIAAEVGYADPFYFSNRFHRSVGQSPTEYRQATGYFNG